MAAWMLGAVVVSTLLGAAGLLAERGLVRSGRPARWSWLLVMTASAGWPFLAGAVRSPGPKSAGGGSVAALPGRLTAETGGHVASLEVLGAVPDGALLGAWCLGSALLVLVILLSAETLKADRRRWRRGTVAGEPVFLSGWLGPAVVGAFRPRIVLPRWILGLDEGIQRLIVRHEREHVRAGDSRLLAGGLLLLVLLPWCLPLWWQLRRLRSAIETDCDMRLLRDGAPAGEYAHALLTVADRRRRVVLPLAGMAPRGATLKRRLRRIASGPPAGRWRRALVPMALASLLALGTVLVPLPGPPSVAALTAPLGSPVTGGQDAMYGPPRADGSLPGDPGQGRIAAEIRAHHSAALASGLPEGSIVWFVVDRRGDVVRTGIERGTEREVTARVRRRYPAETSDLQLAWSDVAAGGDTVGVVWLLPPP